MEETHVCIHTHIHVYVYREKIGEGIFPSSGLLRGIRWFQTDVSGLPVRRFFSGQAVLGPLKMGPIYNFETSVSNHLTLRNNPEDGRIYFNSDGSLRSCRGGGNVASVCIF